MLIKINMLKVPYFTGVLLGLPKNNI